RRPPPTRRPRGAGVVASVVYGRSADGARTPAAPPARGGPPAHRPVYAPVRRDVRAGDPDWRRPRSGPLPRAASARGVRAEGRGRRGGKPPRRTAAERRPARAGRGPRRRGDGRGPPRDEPR